MAIFFFLSGNTHRESFEIQTLTNKPFASQTSGGLSVANINTGVGEAGSGKNTDYVADTTNKPSAPSSSAFGAFSSNGPLAGQVFDGPPPASPVDSIRGFKKTSPDFQTDDKFTNEISGAEIGAVSKLDLRIYATGGAPGSLTTAWLNRSASDYLQILAIKYGQPSAVDPSGGGLAIWKWDKLANGCLTRIELRDEAVLHRQPVNHFDYVYAFVPYSVPSGRLDDIERLSGTIMYDSMKKELSARCGTIEAAIATLALATQILEGTISLNYAHANNLLNHYLTASQDPYQAMRLNDLLCYNITPARKR